MPAIDRSASSDTAEVRVQYVADCPHWKLAESRLRDALRRIGHDDSDVRCECVTSPEDAARFGFRGSPTVLIDGRDPFAGTDDEISLSCRRYRTEGGIGGAPSVEQLLAALSAARS